MSNCIRLALLGGIILAAAAADPEPAATQRTVALKPGLAPWAEQQLTPSCIKPSKGRKELPPKSMVMTHKTGLVEPGGQITLRKEAFVTIAGTQLTFTEQGSSVSYALPRQRPVRLRSVGEGLEPIVIPTSTGGKLPIAFPVVQAISTNGGFNVSYRAAQVFAGSIDKEPVLLVDDELDGIGTMNRDAVSVNSGVVFAPLGEWLPTSGGLFHIESLDPQWGSLVCTPATGPTIRLAIAGPGLAGEIHAVLANDAVSAVVTSSRPVMSQPGQYTLAYGLVIDPAKRITFAGIMPGKSKAVDGTTPLVIGAPFMLNFSSTTTTTPAQRTLTIDPRSLTLTGKQGEQYVGFRIIGQPTIALDGKSLGSFPTSRTGDGLDKLVHQFPARQASGTLTLVIEAVIDGFGKVSGTSQVTL